MPFNDIIIQNESERRRETKNKKVIKNLILINNIQINKFWDITSNMI